MRGSRPSGSTRSAGRNEKLDAANQHGACTSTTRPHSERLREGPDSSSSQEMLPRSVYSCLITEQAVFFRHTEASCFMWEELLAPSSLEVKKKKS